ncbi:hypothetical protein [Salinibaculum rarum]|uniref:hypothetical protein n=1 Tax=Salinibaculum rarum TaxID=3058903 RepID=UPI00265E34B0|nr:hypothetical protein [Salinibaculum sp. KK48]
MSNESNTATVLDEQTVELAAAANDGAELELSEDVAEVLNLGANTTVEMTIHVVNETDVEFEITFPNVDVSAEQRAELKSRLTA